MTLTSAAQAEHHADQLRRDLGTTLDRIVGNLAPSALAAEAMAATKAKTPDWAKRAVAYAETPIGLSMISGVTFVGITVALAMQYRARQRPVRRRRR